MKNKRGLIITLGLLLVVVIGVILIIYFWQGFDFSTKQPYYAVQMEDGEIYFGKISYFPRFTLRDVYIVQSAQDPSNPLVNNFRVTPLSQAALWAPESLTLNRDKVLSISKVAESSQVMEAIRQQ